MRVRRVTLSLSGASMGDAGFNAVEFFPDHPDQMGSWPKGCYTPSQYRRLPWMMPRGWSVPGVEGWKTQGLRFEAR